MNATRRAGVKTPSAVQLRMHSNTRRIQNTHKQAQSQVDQSHARTSIPMWVHNAQRRASPFIASYGLCALVQYSDCGVAMIR